MPLMGYMFSEGIYEYVYMEKHKVKNYYKT